MSASANDKNIAPKITVTKNMRDYSKEPYITEKAARAKEFLEKHGVPDFSKLKSEK